MKNIKPSLIALGLVLFISVQRGLAYEIAYTNPVLPGDFPDPSIVRVGEDFWATATSSEWAPLFPILHSRDLVNWELVGHIFQKKPEWSSRNYWAPEISFYKGKFYVYYVARKNEKEGVLHIACATADKPEGPWTDHGPLIGQPDGSIDGVTSTSENGDRYLLWKNDGNSRRQPTILWAQKLSEDGTKLVGEMKELFRNDAPWEGPVIEGAFPLKHGEWFYVFYAGNGCCGKQCNYGVGVARSKSLLGPYEKNPRNPIVYENEKWRCPGHGSIVNTADGRDFFLYHAYDRTGSVYVGRQAVLDRVQWGEDGWPVVNDGKGPSLSAVSPFGKEQRVEIEFVDEFTGGKLSPRWQWPHSLEPNAKIEKGGLILSSPVERKNDLFGSVVAVQATMGDYAATTSIAARQLKSGTRAGLFAFGDRGNALGVVLGGGKIEVIRLNQNKQESLALIDAPDLPEVQLRFQAKEGHRFQFFVRTGREWRSVGDSDLEGSHLPPWDRGVRVALTVGGTENASARFDGLRITPVRGGDLP